jgi:hypothetical protein
VVIFTPSLSRKLLVLFKNDADLVITEAYSRGLGNSSDRALVAR